MLRFTIFGIPVVVEPWFWLVMAFIGGGLNALSSNAPDMYVDVLLFMLAAFFSVLVHELGHAMTGHKLAGGRVWIRLWAFGGLAYQQGGRFDRKKRCAMILAGPGAGIALGIVAVLSLFILFNPQEALTRLLFYAAYTPWPHAELVNLFPDNRPAYSFINSLIWINLWWSILNLLPVYPLDGGQLMDQFVKSRKAMHKASIITCVIVMVLMLSLKMTMGLIFFAYFAYQNYLGFKEARY